MQEDSGHRPGVEHRPRPARVGHGHSSRRLTAVHGNPAPYTAVDEPGGADARVRHLLAPLPPGPYRRRSPHVGRQGEHPAKARHRRRGRPRHARALRPTAILALATGSDEGPKTAAARMIRGDLCRSSAFYSLATRRSSVKQMRVPVPEKPEERIGSHGSLYQLLLALMLDRWIYCNRTATRPIHTGTQWTKRHPQTIENRLNKRDSRTHRHGLGRAQANS